MSRSAADALAVLALARVGGCVDADGDVPLDVAPLFETVDDLRGRAGHPALAVRRSGLSRAPCRARRSPDGDARLFATAPRTAAWSPRAGRCSSAQVALTALGARSGVRIAFFHGRGGSASPRRRQDRARRDRRAARFGRRRAARDRAGRSDPPQVRHPRARPAQPRADDRRRVARQPAAAPAGAARSRLARDRHGTGAATRARTIAPWCTRTPGFPAYFRAATPIDVIERLRLGSRPSRRAIAGEARRASSACARFPWVFAWSQNRAGLTAWYGVGTRAGAGASPAHGVEAMAEMARDWPFFAHPGRRRRDGAGQVRPGHLRALFAAWPATCTASYLPRHRAPSSSAPATRCSPSRARRRCWPTIRGCACRSACAIPTSIRSACCRSTC